MSIEPTGSGVVLSSIDGFGAGVFLWTLVSLENVDASPDALWAYLYVCHWLETGWVSYEQICVFPYNTTSISASFACGEKVGPFCGGWRLRSRCFLTPSLGPSPFSPYNSCQSLRFSPIVVFCGRDHKVYKFSVVF